MDTRNQQEPVMHSDVFHETQLALFDAYITNELDDAEKAQVEQQLQNCRQCYQLFTEITRLRQSLAPLLMSRENTSAPTLQIAQAVVARIKQDAKANSKPIIMKENMNPAPLTRQKGISRLTVAVRRKYPKGTRFVIAAAVLCALIGIITAIAPLFNRDQSMSRPAPHVWDWQQPKLFTQNSAGTFALKHIELITGKEFRFFYAFKSLHQGTLQASAVSTVEATQTQAITLKTSVIPLGRIDDTNVGIIRVHYPDRPGQIITLQITSPEEGNVKWQLSPLKQVAAEIQTGRYHEMSTSQYSLPTVIWSGPWYGSEGPPKQPGIALFRNETGTQSIFFQIDNDGKVKIITKEQCTKLAVGTESCQ